MKSVVREAVKTNPAGLSQAAGTRAIANELDAARGAFAPQVDLFAETGVQRFDNGTTNNARFRGTAQVGVRANYILYDGYQRANSLYRQAARLDGALYSLLSTTENVALNAVEAYVDVVRHRDLLHIARRNIKRHQQIERQIVARVEGGKSPASDRYQIEERIFAAKAVKVEIQKAYADAVAKFRKVVGRKPGRKMRIPSVGQIPASQAILVAKATANSYAVQAASKRISEGEYAVDEALGQKLPDLSLQGRATAGEGRNGRGNSDSDLYVGLRLSWRVFDGGTFDAEAGAAAARVEEARYARDESRREVAEIARRSWNSWSDGQLRASLLSRQVSANKRIVRNYLEEYELSKRSLLDVLDAERALFNTRFQYQSVRAAYRFAAFRMLAVQSRLAKHFGIHPRSIAPKPNVETRFRSSGGERPFGGQKFFDINIEPLK